MSVRSAAILFTLALAGGAWLGATAPTALAETTSALVVGAGPQGEDLMYAVTGTVQVAAYLGSNAQSFYFMVTDMAHDVFGSDPNVIAAPPDALD